MTKVLLFCHIEIEKFVNAGNLERVSMGITSFAFAVFTPVIIKKDDNM